MLSKEMRTRVTLKLNLWTVVIFHCRPFYFFSFFAHEHYGIILVVEGQARGCKIR